MFLIYIVSAVVVLLIAFGLGYYCGIRVASAYAAKDIRKIRDSLKVRND